MTTPNNMTDNMTENMKKRVKKIKTKIDVSSITEELHLIENAKRRNKCFLANKIELEKMRDVKKGTRYRKKLYRFLLILSNTTFKTEEEEYKRTGKFGRGIWYGVYSTFKTAKEFEFISKIAREYGAFDY